jgi:hypothetical protein
MMQYALGQAGEPYSMSGAIWAGILSILRINSATDDRDNNWQCAKLVTKCIRNTLGKDPAPGKKASSVFPEMLYNWDGFETVRVYE